MRKCGSDQGTDKLNAELSIRCIPLALEQQRLTPLVPATEHEHVNAAVPRTVGQLDLEPLLLEKPSDQLLKALRAQFMELARCHRESTKKIR
jgi:hypothetical protein